MTIVLPWPPSVNSYWRTVNGRTLLSKRAREYKKSVASAVLVHAANKHLAGRLEVELLIHPPVVNRRRDLDNLTKGVLDSLQTAGVYLDDSQIDRLTIERAAPVPGGVVIVTINERRSEESDTGKFAVQKSPAPKRRTASDKGKNVLAGVEGDDARPPRRREKVDQGGEEGREKKQDGASPRTRLNQQSSTSGE